MQELKLIQKDRYDVELLFLHELINVFTRKSNIINRNFYSKINKSLKHVLVLSSLSYNEQGLLSFEVVFENYKKAKKSGHMIYQTTPYFSSLSRLLALIYTEASSILGEEKAKNILKASFNVVKKKYSEIPDLEGYIPKVVLGKAAAAAAAAAYSTILTDGIIKYYVGIIEKGVKPEKIISEVKELKPSKEQELAKLRRLAEERKIEVNYEKLIQELINAVFRLYGQIAIEKANSIQGLQVDKKGKIAKIEGDKKQVLDQLGQRYVDVVGGLGRFITEKELRRILVERKIIKE